MVFVVTSDPYTVSEKHEKSKYFIFFSEVPEEQRNLFLEFHKNHPYSKITVQNQVLEYISCGSGERVLVFLHGALVGPDIETVPISRWNEFHKAYFLAVSARLTKLYFLDYLESIIKFYAETKDFPADTREWKGETVLMGTRNVEDAFKYFDRLIRLYPQASSYIFEEKGGHHTAILFPEKLAEVLCDIC